MYKVLQEIKQNNRCCTVLTSENEEYFAFSESNLLKIYNKDDLILHEISSIDPLYMIKCDNDIIHSRLSSTGDRLGISNMDYVIEIYNVFNNFEKISQI